VHIASLASSSGGGNAYLVWSKSSRPVLIDCGISLRKLTGCLAEIGMSPKDVCALFVTHEHTDHVKSLCLKNPVAQKFGFPAYASPGFWQWYFSRLGTSRLSKEYVKCISPMETVTVDNMRITALAKPHDAREPLAYLFECEGERTGVVMDLGYFPEHLVSALRGVENLVFEANHDVGMERNSGRPYYLIKRVLSDRGHLSNEQSGEALSMIVTSNTKKVVLAHLSEDCNTPERAKTTITTYLKKTGVSPVIEVAPARTMKVF
jgi:phosphoribosyl 1,2-cyclic phosphodiesterase